jgi:hypothetical protein
MNESGVTPDVDVAYGVPNSAWWLSWLIGDSVDTREPKAAAIDCARAADVWPAARPVEEAPGVAAKVVAGNKDMSRKLVARSKRARRCM